MYRQSLCQTIWNDVMWGGKLFNVITHNIIRTNHKTESSVYRWLCAHALFHTTCFAAFDGVLTYRQSNCRTIYNDTWFNKMWENYMTSIVGKIRRLNLLYFSDYTCRYNAWCYVLFCICQNIGHHFKVSVDMLIDVLTEPQKTGNCVMS